MEYQKIERQQERAQEEVLLRFFQAYDEGYPSVLAAIVHHAEQDEAFKAVLWDMVLIYLVEEEQLPLLPTSSPDEHN